MTDANETVSLENLYRMLCHAWGKPHESELRVSEVADFNNVEDLFGFLLSSAVSDILRRGVARGYEQQSEDRRAPKGKLLPNETMKRQLRLRGQVACVFDQWTTNVPANQILKGALLQLGLAVSSTKLAGELRRLERSFTGVVPLPLIPASFRQLMVAPGHRHYGFALDLCALLARWALPSQAGSGRHRFVDPRGDEREMGWVFETFARRYLERHLTEQRVLRERRIDWRLKSELPASQAVVPQMETDIRLDGPNGLTIIEAKFTNDALPAGRDGKRRLRPAHLYQLHAYVTHLAQSTLRVHRAVLLVGSASTSFSHRYRMDNVEWLATSVDLRGPWEAITAGVLAAASH